VKNRGPFESSFSQRAQFEALSSFVWASFLVLAITALVRWQHIHHFEVAFMLPVVHLLPWYVGMIERRRRVIESRGMGQQHSELDGNNETKEVHCSQSLIRVLWGAYSTLLMVEALALWH